MNQAIQFPDRESWDAERQGVVFPALVNGMQLTCAISGQILQQRFGAEGPAQWLAAFQGTSLGSRGRGRSIDPRWSGRCSGLDLVILIQVLIFPFHIVIC
ncbi:Protein of uncharacterised function (DUF1488) [Klebsiella pneumoniae]|nr:Protein of uncharacterised function (DUF1488) [Klebsiella pneumoniae]